MLLFALACTIPDGTLETGTFTSAAGALVVDGDAVLALDDGQTCVTLPGPLVIEGGALSWPGTLAVSQLWPEAQSAVVVGTVDGQTLDLLVDVDGDPIAADRLTLGGNPAVWCKD